MTITDSNTETARKLASIQRITALNPIEGADAIERATVLGWDVVVKKGEFAVGDLAVYLEIDAVPPDTEQWSWLWKGTEVRPKSYRLKTQRFRGQLSQGLVVPLTDVLEQVEIVNGVTEGLDVTEALEITKYEPDLPVGSVDIAGMFFDGISKTDEERLQSNPRYLEYMAGRPFYITTKADGSSMTIANHEGEFRVASRNYRLTPNPDSAYYRAAEPFRHMLERIPQLAIQGELCGPGVQKNPLGFKDHRCLVFNIYDRTEDRFLSLMEMEMMAQFFGFPLVDVLEIGDSFDYSLEDLLAKADGTYPGTTNRREGIVVRNNDDGPRTSFKVISNEFLLRQAKQKD